MPNTLAYVILIVWPLIALVFYKRMPIIEATFWTIVGGFLILPVKVAIDFPFIPPLDKESIPAIAALIGCNYVKKAKIKLLPKNGLERWFVIVLLIAPLVTMLNNQEASNYIPGLTFHDAFSSIVNQYISLLPLILGMQLVKTYEDQLSLFKLLVGSALIYSLFILFEIRMSPQLHSWVYGFFPHSFGQQARFGGFRAVVFLGHGLIVSMYLAVALGAASILLKQKIKIFGIPAWTVILYLFMLLVLNKTVSGFILGLLLFVIITWLSANMIRRSSLFLIFIVLLYPALSILEFFPHEELIQMATDFDVDRGESLAFRFHHEKILLEHAQEKIFFGWGGWGRNFLEGSIKDGYWIGVFGIYGLVGFVALFGLAVLSIVRSTKMSFIIENKNERHMLLSHALIAAVIMIDQIPNSSFSASMVFIIGALFGRVNEIKNQHHTKNNMKNYTSKHLVESRKREI